MRPITTPTFLRRLSMLQAIPSRIPVRLPWHLLLGANLALLNLVPLALFSVAHADPQTIPCATDSQGNPMYFNGAHPYLCTITTTVNPDGSEDVRIDQPVVDQSSF